MKNFLNYFIWPVLAGFGFAATLLLAPWLTNHIPALAAFKAPQISAPATVTVAAVSYSAAIKKAAPAVVSINSLNKVVRTTVKRSLFLSLPYLDQVTQEDQSLGSGVIISKDGYIVTSYHIFFGSDPNAFPLDQQITVTFNDRRVLPGTLVALDQKNDLALIKIDQDNLPFLTLSGNRNPEAGDVVLAIGNARNIGQSVSSGIISARWKTDDSITIQTDAAINPGNSGGALIDVNGDLLGINSTIISESGGSEGISFAIDAGEAIKLLMGFRKEYESTSTKSYLGLTTDVALSIELKNSRKMLQGFHVSSVNANGPADRAGIREGDLITAVGNQEIHFANNLNNPKGAAETLRETAKLTSLPAFQLVMFTVLRDSSDKEAGKVLQIPVILGKATADISDSGPDATKPSASASLQ